MSPSETDRCPSRVDVRAAAAAAVMFGLLGGGAGSRQTAGPAGDGPGVEAVAKPVHGQGGGELPKLPDALEPAPGRSESQPDPPPAVAPAAPPQPRPAAADSGPLAAADVQAIRADASARLKELADADADAEKATADPERKLADKTLADTLQARLKKLDDYDKLAADLAEASRPEADPARRIADARAETADLEARLKQPVEALAPPLFRHDGPVDQASQDQMKDVIAAVRKDVADFQEKLAAAPADPEKDAKAQIAALKADRDKIAANLEAVKARAEALASAPAARTPAERKAAAERGVDLHVDAAFETLRLQLAERKVVRAAKTAEAAAADRARWIAHAKLARRVLEPMEARFRKIAEAQEHELQRKAQTEQARADRERDPIARYKAKRQAELLDLEALVVKSEQLATVGVDPSLEDMKKAATIAAANFARIKQIVEGDEKRAGRVDVFNINADYKRLQPERRRVEREELAVVSKRLADYANALATVELNQIEDSLLDQIDLDDLLDRLPPARHDEAKALWRAMEEKHSDLLGRRRDALGRLVLREQETLEEIDRRLAILEEETSFIRTHLFWIRDQDPIGAATVGLAAGEARRLARVAAGLVRGAATPSEWKPATPGFLLAAAVVALLPMGVFRIRGALRRRLEAALPPSAPPAAVGPAVNMNPVVRQG